MKKQFSAEQTYEDQILYIYGLDLSDYDAILNSWKEKVCFVGWHKSYWPAHPFLNIIDTFSQTTIRSAMIWSDPPPSFNDGAAT